MKKRDEWLTQEAADKQFQRLIDEFNKTPGMLTGYEAAKLLGVEANGPFYAKFRVWQGRQLASASGPVLEVPAEVVAQLRSSITEFGDTLLKKVVENIGSSTGIVSHNAELRVRDAQAKEATARRDGDQLAELLSQVEAERDDALALCGKLEDDLQNSKARNAQLAADVRARDGLIRSIRVDLIARTSATSVPAITTSGGDVRADSGQQARSGGVETDAVASGVEPENVEDTPCDDRPSASEPDRPMGGQSELPLVSTDPTPEREDR
jgi:hypothetical protein